MKKVKRTAAVVALMLATLTVKANDGKLNIVANGNTKSIVFELDSKAGETSIKFFDANNNVIYSESIEKAAFAKRFNLNNLKEGRYYFITEDSLKAVTYTINVDASGVKILDKKEDPKPVFNRKGSMVYLNLLNLGKDEVKMEIFDSSDRLVFSEKWKDTMIIEKVINFKKAYVDNYTIVVKEGGNAYYETVKIN